MGEVPVKPRTTTLEGAGAATIGEVVHTRRLTVATDAHRFRTGLPLMGALPVALDVWLVLTAIGAPFYLTYSVLHVNGWVMWPSTVICLPPLSAWSGT